MSTKCRSQSATCKNGGLWNVWRLKQLHFPHEYKPQTFCVVFYWHFFKDVHKYTVEKCNKICTFTLKFQRDLSSGKIPTFWASVKYIYRVSWGECARFRENVPYVKVHRSNPKRLYPKLNGYGDNGERKVWSSCGFTYCTCSACCYPYTAHVRPSVSQPSQAHSAFIINRCHSYSEL